MLNLAAQACEPIYPFRYWCLPDKKAQEKEATDKATENTSLPEDKPEDSGLSLELGSLDVSLSPTDIEVTVNITNNYYESPLASMPEVDAVHDAA